MANLFGELKRRNVVRVGIAYVVLGWVALQLGDILFDMFETPDWVGKTIAALLLLGFPFACLFAWAFEMTPEGVKKTAEVDASDSITHSTGRKLDFIIIAALVAALGYFIWDRQGMVEQDPDTPTTVDRSIAVLPFVNMSSDEEQEWFADGLTEEILNSLARTPDLLVASRTSSFQFKGASEDISAIAAKLGVAHILEGSVRRGGDRLRVTAQLIRASDGFHLWSETFDREPKDVIEIQENVAIEIANALETAMDPEALKKMVSAGTASVGAYEAYLQGLAIEGQVAATGNPADWVSALAAHERATTLDEDFALAYWHQMSYWESALGVTDVGSGVSELSTDEELEIFLIVADAAIRSAADSTLALKFKATKADVQLRFRDSANFAREYVEQQPNDSEGLGTLMDALASMRDAGTATKYVEHLRHNAGDDPLLLNGVLNNLLFVGLPEEALELTRDALARFPDHAFLAYQGHRIFLWNGAVEEARNWAEVVRRSDAPEENIQLVLLRQACAENNLSEASRIAAELTDEDGWDISIAFIVLQLMNKPEEAHQILLDEDLDLQAQRSFLGYPYFNHTYFPELAEILERQSIDRPFISGPPYRCDQ